MFERVQAYPEYMIDDRKGMHMAHRLVSCVKNRLGEEKQDTLSQQPLNINSSQAVRIRFGTSPSQKKKGETKEKYHALLPAQVPASRVVKGFPGGNCRQERADAVSGQEDGRQRADKRVSTIQSQRKTGAEGHSVRPRRWETSRRQSREGKSEHGRRK